MKNRRKNEEKREKEEKRKRKRRWKKEKIRVQENIWSLKISEISNFFQRMGVVEKISMSENLFQN